MVCMGKMNLSDLEREELEGLQRKRTAPVAHAVVPVVWTVTGEE